MYADSDAGNSAIALPRLHPGELRNGYVRKLFFNNDNQQNYKKNEVFLKVKHILTSNT